MREEFASKVFEKYFTAISVDFLAQNNPEGKKRLIAFLREKRQ
jgi:hypothetical protein